MNAQWYAYYNKNLFYSEISKEQRYHIHSTHVHSSSGARLNI